MTHTLLLFVEDPGAANFILPAIKAMEDSGLKLAVFADGAARSLLSANSIAFEDVTPSTDFKSLLASGQFAAALCGTSENLQTRAFDVIATCKTAGIVSVGFVDGPSNAAYRFSGDTDNPKAHMPDHLLVPDALTRDEFLKLGVPNQSVHITGHPQYDLVRAKCQSYKSDPDATSRALKSIGLERKTKPVVVFAAEISTGLNPSQYQKSADYTLQGTSGATGRTEVVVEEFLAGLAHLSPRPYVVLRLHPKNTREEFAPYLSGFDFVSQGGSPHDPIWAADLVVGMSSVMLTESLLFGKRVLSILPRECEKDWLPAAKAGLIPCATQSHEVKRWLAQLLEASSSANVSDDAIAKGFVFGAAANVAAVVNKIIRAKA